MPVAMPGCSLRDDLITSTSSRLLLSIRKEARKLGSLGGNKGGEMTGEGGKKGGHKMAGFNAAGRVINS